MDEQNNDCGEKEEEKSNKKVYIDKSKAGIKIGNYILKHDPIGEGTFGKVYLAIDDKNKFYAAKSIDNLRLRNFSTKQKFIRELCLSHKLKNEHIIKLHDVKKTKSHIYLFLEYCDGETLDSFLKNYINLFNHFISMELIQYFTKQIIEGLYYMNKKKCVHRDLKLENIMLSYKIDSNINKSKTHMSSILNKNENEIIKNLPVGVSIYTFNCFHQQTEIPKYYIEENLKNEKKFIETVKNYIIKLIDLGFTREIEEEENTKSFCGSPLEMAPEIWDLKYNKGEKSYNYDYRVDLWSLGVVLYKLAFNNFPFIGQEFKKIYYNILKGDYYIPNNDFISIEFIDLINGLLKLNPNARYNYDILINHPFINKDFKDLTIYEFRNNNPLDLNSNDYQKTFLPKINLIKVNISCIKEDDDDNENDDKYIQDLFVDDKCTIIEYSTISEDMNNGWVYTRLNNYLEEF